MKTNWKHVYSWHLRKRSMLHLKHAIFLESVNLLAASDPEASVHDIDYGGDINDEDIDDQ